MRRPTATEFAEYALGEAAARRRLLTGAVVVVLLASVGFLLGSEVVRSWPLLGVALALVVYAGWSRAGVATSVFALWLLVLWRFSFPPVIGYLRGSGAHRYSYPRMLAVEYDPAGELSHGLEAGLTIGLLFAVLVGTLVYSGGYALRRLTETQTQHVEQHV